MLHSGIITSSPIIVKPWMSNRGDCLEDMVPFRNALVEQKLIENAQKFRSDRNMTCGIEYKAYVTEMGEEHENVVGKVELGTL